MSTSIKRKLRGLWRSRTHWGGAVLAFAIGLQPLLMGWLNYRLTPASYAFAGVIVYCVMQGLRWITRESLEDKGK